MTTISNIPEKVERFINQERLEQIKTRVQRLPPGNYKIIDDELVCEQLDAEGNLTGYVFPIAKIERLGTYELFRDLKDDIEALISHVENADIENDILLEKIKILENKNRTNKQDEITKIKQKIVKLKPFQVMSKLEKIALDLEDCIWDIELLEDHETIHENETDLITSKELIQSTRDLCLHILKSIKDRVFF